MSQPTATHAASHGGPSARAAVVLAAGKGTRFRSERAKVLHRVAGRTMLRWVLEALRPLGLDRIVVVVGHQADEVRAEVEAAGLEHAVTVEQPEQRGTGHAVRCAVDDGALAGIDRVLVVSGDLPLLTPEALAPVLDAGDPAATLLTCHASDPTGYGRVVRDARGQVARVVEERDATDEERALTEVNTSVYVFDAALLATELDKLSTDNVQGEEYLTDVVAPLTAHGVGAVLGREEDVTGVNDRAQLAAVGAVLRGRILSRLMRDGVTVEDPATTYIEADVVIEPDTLVRPATHLEGATRIAAHAEVGPGCRLVDTTVGAGASVTHTVAFGARIGDDATVGPFTYLRPGTVLGTRSKAGAFVEMKSSRVGDRSKVPHLSYIGDTEIGEDSNIGAATVTVNYDGFSKHRTVVGDRTMVGSDTMLVAPVTVGSDAYTGAGSVITTDVPDGALAVERGEQRTVEGWTARKRAREQARKDS